MSSSDLALLTSATVSQASLGLGQDQEATRSEERPSGVWRQISRLTLEGRPLSRVTAQDLDSLHIFLLTLTPKLRVFVFSWLTGPTSHEGGVNSFFLERVPRSNSAPSRRRLSWLALSVVELAGVDILGRETAQLFRREGRAPALVEVQVLGGLADGNEGLSLLARSGVRRDGAWEWRDGKTVWVIWFWLEGDEDLEALGAEADEL